MYNYNSAEIYLPWSKFSNSRDIAWINIATFRNLMQLMHIWSFLRHSVTLWITYMLSQRGTNGRLYFIFTNLLSLDVVLIVHIVPIIRLLIVTVSLFDIVLLAVKNLYN
jgi:hypothetical protein